MTCSIHCLCRDTCSCQATIGGTGHQTVLCYGECVPLYLSKLSKALDDCPVYVICFCIVLTSCLVNKMWGTQAKQQQSLAKSACLWPQIWFFSNLLLSLTCQLLKLQFCHTCLVDCILTF
jgi:hypothetical protein